MRWPRWTWTDRRRAGAATMPARWKTWQASEPDAALGNGGLGRLAACFLDSMATLGLPSYGYGIRYEFGMFAQSIQGGARSSTPTPGWKTARPGSFRAGRALPGALRRLGRAAELARKPVPVWRHAGEVGQGLRHGDPRPRHAPRQHAAAVEGRAPAHIDLHAFNSGDYARAAEFKNQFENISWVLYPNDSTPAGRELRLRQEYFFTSASIQDILARHLAEHGSLANLADKVAIHLNDTHPAIGVAELMRLLVDEHGFPGPRLGDHAEGVQLHQPHADARGAGDLAGGADAAVLPRHLEIIFRINHEFLVEAGALRPGDMELPAPPVADRRSMASAACAWRTCRSSAATRSTACRRCTRPAGRDHLCRLRRAVARALHQHDQRRDAAALAGPGQPGPGGLIDQHLGSGWRLDLDQLGALRAHADDAGFRAPSAPSSAPTSSAWPR
jgi:starch phosphorylase